MNAIKMFRMGLAVSLLLVGRGIAGDGPAVLSDEEEEALKATVLDDAAVLNDPADFQTRANSLDRYVRRARRRSEAWVFKQIERFPPQAALYRVVLRDIRAQPMEIVKPGALPASVKTTPDGGTVIVFPPSEKPIRAVINAVIEVEMIRAVTSFATEHAFQSLINLAAGEDMPFEIRIEATRQARFMLDPAHSGYSNRYTIISATLYDEIIEESLTKLEKTSVTLSKTNRIGLEEYADASLETAIESTKRALRAAKGKHKRPPPVTFHEIGGKRSEK